MVEELLKDLEKFKDLKIECYFCQEMISIYDVVLSALNGKYSCKPCLIDNIQLLESLFY